MPYTGADADSDLQNAARRYRSVFDRQPRQPERTGSERAERDGHTNRPQKTGYRYEGRARRLRPDGRLLQRLPVQRRRQNTLDNLQRTQQTIAKAFGIATAVLGLATAIEGGDALSNRSKLPNRQYRLHVSQTFPGGNGGNVWARSRKSASWRTGRKRRFPWGCA